MMTSEEKRAFLVESVNDIGLAEKLRNLFVQMISGTVIHLLPPEKSEMALKLASEIIDANMQHLIDKLVEQKAKLLTDEEIEAMAQFHRSPVGRSVQAKMAQDAAAGEAIGNEWFKTLMPLIEDAWDGLF